VTEKSGIVLLEERSIGLLFSVGIQYHMSATEIENYEQLSNRLDSFDPTPPPPPEPIYDLTTSDNTELVKAAGPIERGENP
jgi:hypothetical protein